MKHRFRVQPDRNKNIVPLLCRDCLNTADMEAGQKRCPACASTRILQHPELHDLTIAHLDCDAFFAAIEKRDNPALKNRPVIVGGGHRGVVSTCCYIARISGVRSAMPMFQARKLCPDAVVIKPHGRKYAEAGYMIRDMMRDLTPLVQPLSIDEAFLDLSGTQLLHKMSPAQQMAKLVKRIEEEVGISASVGLSHNKFLAKLASDMDKPRGFTIIGRAETQDILDALPVTRLWGVGKAMAAKLEKAGVRTVAQLRAFDEEELVRRYQSMGAHLYRLARGIDARRVNPERTARSISAETTFNTDIADADVLAHKLWPLCEKVSARLKKKGVAGTHLVLKLKSAGFKQKTRNIRLDSPTQLAETMYREAEKILPVEADGADAYRLIGIGAAGLVDAEYADQPSLLDPDLDRRKKLETAMDALREKMGADAVIKGRSLADND